MEVENLDIKSFLSENGYPVRESSGEISTVALFRGGKNYNISINKKSGLWIDYKTTDGGTFPKLVRIITGQEINEENFSFSNTNWVDELKLPKKFDKSILETLIKDHSYWENRKISHAVCESLSGGIVNEVVMPKFKDRYLIPIFDARNNLIGFTGRYIGNSKSKWISKYKHESPKSTFVWPRDPAAIQNKTVILTESPACCMSFLTLGINNSICLFGTSCSQAIINYLISNSVSKIIIATNNEPDNENIGNLAAGKIKLKLDQFFDNVEIRLPKFKDINDWLISGGSNKIIEYYK